MSTSGGHTEWRSILSRVSPLSFVPTLLQRPARVLPNILSQMDQSHQMSRLHSSDTFHDAREGSKFRRENSKVLGQLVLPAFTTLPALLRPQFYSSATFQHDVTERGSKFTGGKFRSLGSACTSRLHNRCTGFYTGRTKIIWRVETKESRGTCGTGISIREIFEGIWCPYFPVKQQIATSFFSSSKEISLILYPKPVLGTKKGKSVKKIL